MTCIAWDGKTLAADKRATFACLPYPVTKIYRVHDGLFGIAGDGAQGMDMLAWYRSGCDADKFPVAQRDKEQWANIVVVKSDGLWIYERAPQPMRLETTMYATGHGRDFALAAMFLGRSAREAVEIACRFDTTCGDGVDTLTLEAQA